MMMLIALYLLYRIAFPKQPSTQAGDNVSEKGTNIARSVMGKSRFVLPDRSKPFQTPAISGDAESNAIKAVTFALENQEKRPAVIPPDELDRVFAEEPNPEDLDIPPDDEDETEIDLTAEEDEEWNRGLGHEAMFADGLDFDDLQHVAKVVREQPETVNRETGAKIVAMEHTDMFETLVSGDEGKMNWIKSVIDRHFQSILPETESKTSETDYGNFDIADFLGKTIKK